MRTGPVMFMLKCCDQSCVWYGGGLTADAFLLCLDYSYREIVLPPCWDLGCSGCNQCVVLLLGSLGQSCQVSSTCFHNWDMLWLHTSSSVHYFNSSLQLIHSVFLLLDLNPIWCFMTINMAVNASVRRFLLFVLGNSLHSCSPFRNTEQFTFQALEVLLQNHHLVISVIFSKISLPRHMNATE